MSNYQENWIEIILTIIYASVPFFAAHLAGLILYFLILIPTSQYSSNFGMDLFFVVMYVLSIIIFEKINRQWGGNKKYREHGPSDCNCSERRNT